MTMARHVGRLLLDHAARRLSPGRRPWADPMRQEVESIEDDWAALRRAAGCVAASYSERITVMRIAPVFPLLAMVALLLFMLLGYALGGGHLDVILEALPHNLLVVGLGALATTWVLT